MKNAYSTAARQCYGGSTAGLGICFHVIQLLFSDELMQSRQMPKAVNRQR